MKSEQSDHSGCWTIKIGLTAKRYSEANFFIYTSYQCLSPKTGSHENNGNTKFWPLLSRDLFSIVAEMNCSNFKVFWARISKFLIAISYKSSRCLHQIFECKCSCFPQDETRSPHFSHFGPRVYPRGSLVIALVRPSVRPWSVVRPSVFKYLRDCSKDFSNFLHEVSAP